MEQIVRIISSEHLTHDVLRLVVEKPGGLTFIPGQAVDISINNRSGKMFSDLSRSLHYLKIIILNLPLKLILSAMELPISFFRLVKEMNWLFINHLAISTIKEKGFLLPVEQELPHSLPFLKIWKRIIKLETANWFLPTKPKRILYLRKNSVNF